MRRWVGAGVHSGRREALPLLPLLLLRQAGRPGMVIYWFVRTRVVLQMHVKTRFSSLFPV